MLIQHVEQVTAPHVFPIPAVPAGSGDGGGCGRNDLPPGFGPILVVPRQRKLGLGYGGKIMGFHPVRPGHGSVPYESTLERDLLPLLGGMNCLHRVVAQPVTIHFHYYGRRFRYTPDFWVWLSVVPPGLAAIGVSITRFFVEVKPTERLAACQQDLDIKLMALRIGTGLSTILCTEMEIRNRPQEYFYE